MSKLTQRKAKIRLYDSTATPWFLEFDLDVGDFSGPIGIPRQEEILVLNRGLMDNVGHYIKGADDKLMEPVQISFSVLVRDDTQTVNILNWLKGCQDAGATQVNAHTLATTKADTQRDGANANPAFADTNKLCSNVEYLMETGGTDLGFKYAEVFFPLDQQTLSEAEDGITLALTGTCYGTITRITAFTAGTDVEA
jgi:hypothetical protein